MRCSQAGGRPPQDEQGFTLVELMVVVLIIGILIAIALPSFLGARTRSQDKAAASDLRNAVAAAKTYFTDGDTYTGFTTAVAANTEPSLAWNAGGGSGPAGRDVDIEVASGTTVLMTRLSQSGTYLCAVDDAYDSGIHRGDATFASVDTALECEALPLV